MSQRELPRARSRLPRRAAARRDAPAPRPAPDRAVARREAALAERPRDHAQLPAPAPALQAAARLQLSMPRAGARSCGRPTRPSSTRREFTLRERRRVVQRERRRIGLRSVEVKRGHLWLNNRRIQLRGASIHEDMPGSGAALTGADMDRYRRRPEGPGRERHARALPAERAAALALRPRRHPGVEPGADLAARRGARLLWQREGARAGAAQRCGARSPPRAATLGAHPLGRQRAHLHAGPASPARRRFLLAAQAQARDIDPTLPISVDIKGRAGFAEQFTYHSFDLIGLNQYFGWYRWVEDFSLLEPYIRELRDLYPGKAIVMTEWGAEGRPELADAPPDLKGGYPFQTFHAARTLDVIDRSPALSGAIYWTLREFEIYPGWQGGAGRRPPEFEPNTRHHKGLITYEGERKPVFDLLRERFRATPLYPCRAVERARAARAGSPPRGSR